MPRKLRMTLSVDSVNKLKKEIRDYRNSLTAKSELLCARLAEQGISVAVGHINSDSYAPYIIFGYTTPVAQNYGAETIMFAKSTGNIVSVWYGAEDVLKSAEVSPLLMVEFGAGVNHDKNPKAKQLGMGAGTFPEQTHAFQKEGWYYKGEDEIWHHTDGLEPSMPMWSAFLELKRIVRVTVRRVFRSY